MFLFDKSLAHDNAHVNIPVTVLSSLAEEPNLTFNSSAMRKKQINRSPSLAKTCT